MSRFDSPECRGVARSQHVSLLKSPGSQIHVDLRHTDFHFTMPKYGSLPEWEARKAQLRRQILVAVGLYPLHEKTPLKPLISGRIERDGYGCVALQPAHGGLLSRGFDPASYPTEPLGSLSCLTDNYIGGTS